MLSSGSNRVQLQPHAQIQAGALAAFLRCIDRFHQRHQQFVHDVAFHLASFGNGCLDFGGRPWSLGTAKFLADHEAFGELRVGVWPRLHQFCGQPVAHEYEEQVASGVAA